MPTLTITTDATQSQRIQDAWQHRFGKAPSSDDVKKWLCNELRDLVRAEEAKTQIKSISQTPFNPT